MHGTWHHAAQLVAVPCEPDLKPDVPAIRHRGQPPFDPGMALKNEAVRTFPNLLPGWPNGREPIRISDDFGSQSHTVSPAWWWAGSRRGPRKPIRTAIFFNGTK